MASTVQEQLQRILSRRLDDDDDNSDEEAALFAVPSLDKVLGLAPPKAASFPEKDHAKRLKAYIRSVKDNSREPAEPRALAPFRVVPVGEAQGQVGRERDRAARVERDQEERHRLQDLRRHGPRVVYEFNRSAGQKFVAARKSPKSRLQLKMAKMAAAEGKIKGEGTFGFRRADKNDWLVAAQGLASTIGPGEHQSLDAGPAMSRLVAGPAFHKECGRSELLPTLSQTEPGTNVGGGQDALGVSLGARGIAAFRNTYNFGESARLCQDWDDRKTRKEQREGDEAEKKRAAQALSLQQYRDNQDWLAIQEIEDERLSSTFSPRLPATLELNFASRWAPTTGREAPPRQGSRVAARSPYTCKHVACPAVLLEAHATPRSAEAPPQAQTEPGRTRGGGKASSSSSSSSRSRSGRVSEEEGRGRSR